MATSKTFGERIEGGAGRCGDKVLGLGASEPDLLFCVEITSVTGVPADAIGKLSILRNAFIRISFQVSRAGDSVVILRI